MVGSSLKSRTALPSSVRPGRPSVATRLLGKATSRANQGRNKKIPALNDADSQVRPRHRTAGASPDAISTGPPGCYALDAHRALSSSSQMWRMTRWASRSARTGASERPSCQEWARHPIWMALAVVICRCSPKLSLRPNCTPRYSRYWTHCVCRCWSMRRTPYA